MLSVLEYATTPATEPVPTKVAAAHLRVDADDPMVRQYVGAAREWVENYTGRLLMTRQVRWTITTTPPPGGWPMVGFSAALIVLPQWLSPSQIGVRPLTFPRQPVISVDSVAVGTWTTADVALTTDQYAANASLGLLNVFGARGLGVDGHLTTLFTAGHGNTPEEIPWGLRQATLLMAAHFYEHRGDTEAVPPAAASMLLNPFRKVSFG